MTASNEEPDEQCEPQGRECQRLLLNFYSSQLNTHSRIIIGFSVILLTLVEVVSKTSLAKEFFYFRLIPYLAMFFVAFALYYSFFRLILYGVLSHSVLIAEPKGKEKTLLLRINMDVERETLRKGLILPIIRAAWFLSHNKDTHESLCHNKNSHERCNQELEKAAGFVVCAIFAFITTALLVWFLESTSLSATTGS